MMAIATYELYKLYQQEWIEKHPNCTSAEYDQAMREIATRLGI